MDRTAGWDPLGPVPRPKTLENEPAMEFCLHHWAVMVNQLDALNFLIPGFSEDGFAARKVVATLNST